MAANPFETSHSITISADRRSDHITVLAVGGDVDFITAPELQRAIESVISEGLTALIIDMSEVRFADSASRAVLAWTTERLGDAVGFAVVANHQATRRPIRLTGLDDLFALCGTLDEAVSHVLSTQRDR